MLISLTHNGELGKVLVRTFGGTLGYTYPNKDADFLIVFEQESDVPEATKLERTIVSHYKRLGFVPGYAKTRGDTVEVTIKSTEMDCVLGVVVTTHYPFDGHYKALRATTNLIH